MANLFKVKLWVSIMIALVFSSVIHAQDALLHIPSLEIDTQIIPLTIRKMRQGTTWDTAPLSQNVGYLTGTSWFGQRGNIVLGGHSEGDNRTPEVFYHLDEIQVGDEIHATVDGQTYSYIVASVESVDPSNLESVLPTQHDQLTLITCDTTSFDGSTYQQRWIVRAVPA